MNTKTNWLLFSFIVVLLFVVSPLFGQTDLGKLKARPPIHIGQPTRPFSPLAGPSGVSPTQIRAAYGLPSTGGIGTIAIIDAYDNPSAQNDFNVFSSQFGLLTATTTNFEIHKMGAVPGDTGWGGEIALDIQWAHAIAPNAKILLVEALSASGTDLLSAVDYARLRSDVVAISMSWGATEFSGSASFDSYFTSAYGASFFASAGDGGHEVEWPAVSANVTGVGGTEIIFTGSTTVSMETAWAGSGGGLSSFVSEPSYQSSFGIPTANGFRGVPDVSYNGGPNSAVSMYDTYGNSGWLIAWGTSAGSPQWAAIRALGGVAVNTTLYAGASTATRYATNFRDITVGANSTVKNIYTKATTKYDYVTGLGSPLGIYFSVPPSAAFYGSNTSGFGPLTVNFTDTSLYNPTGWSWSFGDGSTSTSQNPTHLYGAVTTPTYYTVRLIVTNSNGTSTSSRSNYVFVTESSANAGFFGSPTTGTSPLIVNFTDTSANSPTAWSWNFGDSSTNSSQNPSHTYTSSTAASYTVTLIASNSFGTTTSIRSNYIKVNSGPTAGFFGSPTSGFTPLTVNFTDTSVNSPTGWNWSFGDGSTSNTQNPSHVYTTTSTATYTVQLIVTNSIGTSTSIRTNYIKVTPPPPNAGFFGSPTSGASPLLVNFTDTSGNSPTSWSWSFGDGASTSIQNPSHTYTSTSSATYSVTLVATNAFGTSTSTRTNYIKVIPPPVAGFFGSPTSGTSPLSVNFTDTSANSPTGWSWSFGDGSTSNTQNPSHTYASTSVATYTGQLIVTNSVGTSTSIRTHYIVVTPPPPSAGFFGSPTSGTSPLLVNFTDTSGNSPTSRSWTFGDGASTSIQNPSHTYSTPSSATYTVVLIATNAFGSSTSTRTNYIKVVPPPPVAGFFGSPTSGVSPLTVNFTDTSANSPTAWSWSFGDGSTSTSQNPSHTYTTSTVANFTVTLIATNSFGTSTSIMSNYINVTPAPPVAGYFGSPTSGVSPLTVNFTDTSANNPTSWNWSFGDGSTSSTQNPSHQYTTTTSATYTVTLIASNAFGTSTSTRTNYIKVTPPAPTSGFYGSPTSGSSPLNVNFTDTSANNPTSWSWTFGDGNTSSTQNPSHQYTTPSTANYTVTLIVTNAFGSGTSTITNYIHVTPPPPVAGFSGSPTNGTSPLTVNFTDTSANNPTSWSWSFGDGSTSNLQNPSHTYNTSIITMYTVSLVASNAFGTSTSTLVNYISVNPPPPNAGFYGTPTSGISPLNVNFTDTSDNSPTSWSWNFGDSSTSGFQNPSHVYTTTTSATYTVTLIASNLFGASTSTRTNYIKVNPPVPIAGFFGSPTSGTSPVSVSFTDTSLNSPTSWAWTFGDGSTSNVQNPSHTYTTSSVATFTVTLIAGNVSGVSTTTQTNYIKVFPAPPVAGFFGSPTSGTTPLLVNFTDTSANNPTTWSWNFGDGSTNNIQNPSHTYTTTSVETFTVTLVVTNSFGTSTSVRTNYIKVSSSPPVAGFYGSPTSGNSPLLVNFVDTSANSPTSWAWTFGDGSTDNTQSPSHTYTSGTSAVYSVTLIASNVYGSSTSTINKYIVVTPPPPVAGFFGSPTSGNGPLSVNFTDTSYNYFGNSTSWNWNFGDGSTSNLRNPSHPYAAVVAPASYTVRLIVTTNFGTSTSTQVNYITVTEPSPSAGFTASSTSGFGPLNVNFNDTSANLFGNSTTWSWSFGDGLSTTLRHPQHIYAPVNSATTYTARLIVTTNFGSSTATQLISVTEPSPNAGFSGTPTGGTGPLLVNFTDTSGNYFGNATSWNWNFGDSSTSNLRNPSHTYAAVSTPTSYTVRLIVTTNFGVSTANLVNYITVGQLPVSAGFTASPLSGYGPLTVNFVDTSAFSPTGWSWDYGDGFVSSVQNPQHIYAAVSAPTTYTVRLIATNSFGTSTAIHSNAISVTEPAPPAPSLIYPVDTSLFRGLILFSWTTSTDIVSSPMKYTVQMARDTGFVSIVTTISNLTTTSPLIGGIPPGPVEWHVQATSVFGTSSYSPTQQVLLFDTADRQPVTSAHTANFFIGDTSGQYLPVMAVFNSIGTDTVFISTIDSTAPGLPAGHFISRYWKINRTGNSAMDVTLTFSYSSADFADSGISDESTGLFAARDSTGAGGWYSITTGVSVNPANHTLTVTGITQFSNWTLGNFNSVPINDWWKYSNEMAVHKRE